MSFHRGFFVYALKDPRDQAIRYIGKSCGGLAVARRHQVPSGLNNSKNPAKNMWLSELRSIGRLCEVEILEEFSTSEGLGIAEREWIAEGRRIGLPLFNITDGGEQAPGFKMSEATKAKISARLKGRYFSPELRQKISDRRRGIAVWTGKKHSEATKAKMSSSAILIWERRRGAE